MIAGRIVGNRVVTVPNKSLWTGKFDLAVVKASLGGGGQLLDPNPA